MLRWYSMSTFWSKESGVPDDFGDHRVVDDQLHRDQGIDLGRVAPHLGQGVAHGGQVDDAGHAGEVLHEDPLGGEGDLGGVAASQPVPLGVASPVGHRFDVRGVDGDVVLVAEQVLEDDLHRIGEPGDVVPVGQGIDPEDLVGPVADGEVGPGAEAVGGG